MSRSRVGLRPPDSRRDSVLDRDAGVLRELGERESAPRPKRAQPWRDAVEHAVEVVGHVRLLFAVPANHVASSAHAPQHGRHAELVGCHHRRRRQRRAQRRPHARARASPVLVLDGGAPRNGVAAHMHGVLGRDGWSPLDLLAAGRDEVRRYGVVVESGEVAAAGPGGAGADARHGGFEVAAADGTRHVARRLLVATGVRDGLARSSRASPSSGDRAPWSARTATAGRCATAGSACSPAGRWRCTRRSSCGSGRPTSPTS